MLGSRRAGASQWLLGARDDQGGLLVPGRPSPRSASDLWLGADHAEVRAGHLVTTVEWADCIAGRDLHRPGGDAWSLGRWSSGRGGSIGIALLVDGRYVAATEPVRAATNTAWNRLNRIVPEGEAVPLCALAHVSWTVDADRDVITMLCAILSGSPALRAKLAEPARVVHLAVDLARKPLGPVAWPTGVRRETTEVLTALRSLGYVHRFGGRPLPGETLAPVDELLDEVLAFVASNPYAKGVSVHPDRARDVIERVYLDVEPWPIAALIDQ